MLDFVMKMDGVDIRTAAKKVADVSGIGYSAGDTAPLSKAQTATPKAAKASQARPAATAVEDAAVEELDGAPYNKVLTFELKNLVTDHPFFAERGLIPTMIERFGLGIATRGIMKHRLVFPIHNAAGQLVAYCGRFVGDDPPEDEPKYKLPPHFRKELELFNWHRAKERASDEPIILVESFFSVAKMYPTYPVISPMGRSLSAQQIELLKEVGVSSVVVLFDGDDPGRAAVSTVGRQLLAEGFRVAAPVVPEDFKPHRCTDDELAETLGKFL